MNYYIEIKQKLIDNEIYEKVKDYSKERNKVNTYYEVGKLLSKAGKQYGEGIIKEYSKKLTSELGKGYSTKSLFKYRKFFLLFKNVSTLSRQMTWSHYDEILKFSDIKEINYYIKLTETQNLSVRELRSRIKNKEYERLPEETKNKIVKNEKPNLEDYVKNPIIIHNPNNIEVIKEKTLQKLILEDIPSFLKELGTGFTFIDSEYKIKIGDTYNYIDILLFNYIYNCFVVVELKTTKLRKEHIGQIEVYMNYIDKNLKTINQDKTIGIIISKKDNKYLIEYSSDPRIISSEYELVI